MEFIAFPSTQFSLDWEMWANFNKLNNTKNEKTNRIESKTLEVKFHKVKHKYTYNGHWEMTIQTKNKLFTVVTLPQTVYTIECQTSNCREHIFYMLIDFAPFFPLRRIERLMKWTIFARNEVITYHTIASRILLSKLFLYFSH